MAKTNEPYTCKLNLLNNYCDIVDGFDRSHHLERSLVFLVLAFYRVAQSV